MNRIGEKEQNHDRSKRVYKDGDYWYYMTREKVSIGPFDSSTEADKGVSDFVDFIIHAEPSVAQTLSLYSAAA